MAQKESHHREIVEGLNTQLGQVQRQLDDLTTLSRDQVRQGPSGDAAELISVLGSKYVKRNGRPSTEA